MIQDLSLEDLSLKDYQIFDVRSPSEWENGILKGVECVALLDDFGSFNENFLKEFQKNFDASKKPAFICRSGHRSKIAAQIVAEHLGIIGVNLAGGMLGLGADL
ncbi:rhodanese-like domain-containing protein [Campylobacter cuniculorum]|uniref:Rhodanese-like domain-containing protein n=2 Tax=Campylobacter cuniculorum TaxID=374106 RepID=A0ABX6U6Z7_9BACT|nr:rhodanese-like domain-containing protein [Campylobacter cuniculorum]ARJ55963.1 putative rhodanese-related sulfurtransferase [Campylobacter cuniculorum DSM 23162 = LMG 24588]QOR05183.1 rhodanese-like domain-containing protein [Campylobacter cuniculorum]